MNWKELAENLSSLDWVTDHLPDRAFAAAVPDQNACDVAAAFCRAADGVLSVPDVVAKGTGGDLALDWKKDQKMVGVSFRPGEPKLATFVMIGGVPGSCAGAVGGLTDRDGLPAPLDFPPVAELLVRCAKWLIDHHLGGELADADNPLVRGQGKKKWKKRHGDNFTNLNANPLFAGKFRVM